MKIITTKVGPVHTNCYIVFDEKTNDAVIIDPGEKADYFLELLKERDLKLSHILLTHGHFDHIIAVAKIKEKTGAKLVIHKKEVFQLDEKSVNANYGRYLREPYKQADVDIFAKDGTEIAFGGLTAKYIHTPGHTIGSCVIEIADSLFTGDTLFAGECGRCDLPTGSFDSMLVSLKKLYDLDGDYKVYPGHEQFSTLDDERRTNRYMQMAIGK